MKKLLCTLTALTCALTFAACGSSSSSSEKTTTAPASTTEAITETETVTEAASAVTTTAESSAITTTEEKVEDTSAEGSDNVPKSTKDYVELIGESLDITDVIDMAAEMIGAEEGTSFKYNGNKFEIYCFKADDPKIEQAKSGNLTYTIEGFGEFTSNSSVNGDYIMIYDTPDEDVIQAFNNR